MDNLEQIEKRIIEKQQIFNKITLKRQQRVGKINKKIITKDSYVQTEEIIKKKIKLVIENNNDEEIINDNIQTYSNKAIQCSMEIKQENIDKNTIYLKKYFEKIANIEILGFFPYEEYTKLFKIHYLYQFNPFFLSFDSYFNKDLELYFFNDYNIKIKVSIKKQNSIGRYIILSNERKTICKYSVYLIINQPINIKVENFKLFFNKKFIFDFKNDIKYFYSSSNNFVNIIS
ncbi:uncharacterized protein METZ01_LOCUS3606 [marine metagenome]|jgi:hypothetical protein|uniref:Uncharacterized protein n=1 Tax=marine metagenome TaxID=408172 RepID=A0A381N816_9ZZZZ|tara:strand:+ start:3782 stop:4474 length:693 start_codon:yes stop_codon:yes gene_type:complete